MFGIIVGIGANYGIQGYHIALKALQTIYIIAVYYYFSAYEPYEPSSIIATIAIIIMILIFKYAQEKDDRQLFLSQEKLVNTENNLK